MSILSLFRPRRKKSEDRILAIVAQMQSAQAAQQQLILDAIAKLTLPSPPKSEALPDAEVQQIAAEVEDAGARMQSEIESLRQQLAEARSAAAANREAVLAEYFGGQMDAAEDTVANAPGRPKMELKAMTLKLDYDLAMVLSAVKSAQKINVNDYLNKAIRLQVAQDFGAILNDLYAHNYLAREAATQRQ